jgi:hypothetical protein
MATTTPVATSTDKLKPPPVPSRVNYSLGRMLGVEDFQADQDYHRSCLARALLQLCGTGTVFGMKVNATGVWQPNTTYPAYSFVFDKDQNVQLNTGVAGSSGATAPTFATAPGGIADDANGIVWTNQGPINANGWRPNAPFPIPSAIIDTNNNVQVLNGPPIWEPNTPFAKWIFVYDANDNVQVNTGAAGTSGTAQPTFATVAGETVNDGASIVWTCEGPVSANGWSPNTSFTAPAAIVDGNGNIQILTAASPFKTAAAAPVWNTAIGSTTPDGNPSVAAWTCAGPAQNVQIVTSGASVFTAGRISPVWSTTIGSTTLDGSPPIAAWTCAGPSLAEIEVTAGLTIDRVGRLIEVPATVCIRLGPWLNNQAASDLNNAIFNGSLWVDVLATFAACTRGMTPCFATQDDYDATDAFSANRLLDSFAMQLALRTDASSLGAGKSLPVPQDPWSAAGPVPSGGIAGSLAAIQASILQATGGPAAYTPFTTGGTVPVEIPRGFDPSSVLLARISIPATAGAGGQPPVYNLSGLQIDNSLRLFVYPPSLVARSLGFASGTES